MRQPDRKSEREREREREMNKKRQFCVAIVCFFILNNAILLLFDRPSASNHDKVCQ